MKKLSKEKQIEALSNFLKVVSNNENLSIYSMNTGCNLKFTIAEKQKEGGVFGHTKFMTYEEMNHYLMGVLAVQENKIDFKK